MLHRVCIEALSKPPTRPLFGPKWEYPLPRRFFYSSASHPFRGGACLLFFRSSLGVPSGSSKALIQPAHIGWKATTPIDLYDQRIPRAILRNILSAYDITGKNRWRAVSKHNRRRIPRFPQAVTRKDTGAESTREPEQGEAILRGEAMAGRTVPSFSPFACRRTSAFHPVFSSDRVRCPPTGHAGHGREGAPPHSACCRS